MTRPSVKELHEARALRKYGKCPPVAVLISNLQSGLYPADIARMYGVAVQTVYHGIKRAGIDLEAFRQFKNRKADVLAALQSKALEKAFDKIEDTSFRDLMTGANIAHNMERLERGQSTSNISLASLNASVESLDEAEKKLREQLALLGGTPEVPKKEGE